MTIFDAHESGVLAKVRTGRHGRDEVEWSKPFETSLYLQKTAFGETCVVALQTVEFAEFDPRHCSETDTLLITEDYLLEILELPAKS